ncbi:MAG: hypothetical protein AB8B55_18900, partial [Mariniblastus sp.]
MQKSYVPAFALIVLCLIAFSMCDNCLAHSDWLIDNSGFKSKFESETPSQNAESQKFFRLTNGLVTRRFLFDSATGATVGLKNESNDTTVLRAVRPEAVVTINGTEYLVGGLTGQPNHAYLLDEWLDEMRPAENSLQLISYKTSPPVERLKWKQVRHHAPDVKWPPPGIKLTLEFGPRKTDKENRESKPDFRVFVHYELYDGV